MGERFLDIRLVNKLIADKMRDRTTYVLAAIVGTLINAYGHLLVPWIRTSENAFAMFGQEFQRNPGLTLFSIFLAYAFPMCVGIYSAVAARYKNRRVESIADFPDRKPDPVFRARRDGALVEVGARTQKMFDMYRINRAQQILGDDNWDSIIAAPHANNSTTVFFEAEGADYLVTHAPTANDEINFYLTRLPR